MNNTRDKPFIESHIWFT